MGQKALPQIVHTWMYGEMRHEEICASLKKSGADGVDLSIEYEGASSPQNLIKHNVQRCFLDAGLPVYATSARYFHPAVELSSADRDTRENAVSFSKRCVDATAHVGCDRMLVSPSWISADAKLHETYEADFKRAAEAVSQVAAYAAGQGVSILIEPINRYRVSLIHTVAEALRMKAEIGLPNVGVVPDTFHMLIEEKQPLCAVLKTAGKDMGCLHLGDTGRTVPGSGSMDWESVLQCLLDIGYTGPLSHEPVVLYYDEKKMGTDPAYTDEAEQRFTSGIRRINAIKEALLAARGRL